jgi:hypothetical protein
VFKHLGRKFQFNLKDSSLRTEVLKKLEAMMTIVDDSMLTGSQKIWIVDNMVIPKISWDMLIQSFTQSEVSKWQAYLIKHYKKWSGLAASAETFIFFRRKENQGYGLKSLLDCNETQQIVKWMIMKESKDPQARRTFSRRLKRDEQGEIGRGRKTSTCLQIKELSSVVEFEEMRGEVRKRGSTEGVKTRRKSSNRTKVLNVCKRDQEEKRIVPLHAYQMQANWLVWSDKLDRELEKSVEWGKVMTSYSARLLKFVMNAQLNTLPSPDNLKRWNKKQNTEFQCGLCKRASVTAAHMLAGCPYVLLEENNQLVQDRYTWRHNCVLSVIKKHVCKKIKERNKLQKKVAKPKMKKVFVTEGQKRVKSQQEQRSTLRILEKANDWTYDFDLPSEERKRQYQMDQRVCATPFKPDAYIVSSEEKICVVIELTCPMEENMDNWHIKKTKKYEEELTSEVYKMHYVVVEVGARGGLTVTLRNCMKKLGLTKKEATSVVEECVLMARRCSFVIWCQRFNKKFVATEMII